MTEQALGNEHGLTAAEDGRSTEAARSSHHDVFLSHRHTDRPWAQQLCSALSSHGLDVWIDQANIGPGDVWLESIEKGLTNARSVLVLLTRGALTGGVRAEVRFALARAMSGPDLRIVPVTIEGHEPSLDDPLSRLLAQYQQLVLPAEPAAWKDLLEPLAATLHADRARGVSSSVTPRRSGSPFPGLRSFDATRSRYFAGRGREIAECCSRLGEQSLAVMPSGVTSLGKAGHRRWLHIHGPSGVGKSSLVRAGVLPMLERSGIRGDGARVRSVSLRPGSLPLEALAEALQYAFSQRVEVEQLREEGGLRRLLNQRAQHPEHADEVLLLFVDQLEELFTLVAADELRLLFDSRLAEVLMFDSPLYLVTSIRSDFMIRFAELPGLAACLDRASHYFLRPMGADALREAIEQPARLYGLQLEDGLAQRMVSDGLQAKGGLPLLSHALRAVHDRRTADGKLTHQSYEALGGVAGALAHQADSLIASFDDAERDLARRTLVSLVRLGRGTEDTRRPRRKDELMCLASDLAVAERVLQRLSGRNAQTVPVTAEPGPHLVVIGTGTDESSAVLVELTHEVLLRDWTMLRGWLEQDRKILERKEEVEELASAWDQHGRDPGRLPSGATLAFLSGEDLAGEGHAYRVGLHAAAREFLAAASEAAADRERMAHAARERELAHKTRFNRMLGIALPVVAVFAALATYQAWTAIRSRQAAEAASASGRSLLIVSLAESSELNAVEKIALLRAAPEHARGWESAAAGALRERGALTNIFHGSHFGADWMLSPDGDRLLGVLDSGLWLWNIDGTGDPLQLLPGGNRLAFAGDGERLFVKQLLGARAASFGANDRIFAEWSDDLAHSWTWRGAPMGSFRRSRDQAYNVLYSPDGTRVLTLSRAAAQVWHSDGESATVSLEQFPGSHWNILFSGDGRRLLVHSRERERLQVWNTENGRIISEVDGDLVLSRERAAFSPDGTRLVTASPYSEGALARVWSFDAALPPVILRGSGGVIDAVAFSPDGLRVALGSSDHTARIWNADGSGTPVVLSGHEGNVTQIAFSADGRRVVTASSDHSARIWNADGSGLPQVIEQKLQYFDWIQLSPDGSRLFTSARESITRSWDLAGPQEPVVLRGHEGAVTTARFSPDGTLIFTGSSDGTARLWAVNARRSVRVFEGHSAGIEAVAFSPDAERVATASLDQTVRIWSIRGSAQPLVLEGGGEPMLSVAFSPDGQRLVTNAGGQIRTWGAYGIREAAPPPMDEHLNVSVRFDSEGRRIINDYSDGREREWSSRRVLFSQHAPAARSPDGRFEVLGSGPKARVKRFGGWDEYKEFDLEGHDGDVTCIAVSPDGQRILTASKDSTARLWNSDGSGNVVVFRGHDKELTSAAFSPDGKRIVTTSEDGTARIWSIDFEDALWRATPHCIPAVRLEELLGDTPERARDSYGACRAEVERRRGTANGYTSH
jgi:WD40 repeat protein